MVYSYRSDLFTPLMGADDCCSGTDLESRLEQDRTEFGNNIIRAITGLRVDVRPHIEGEDRINLRLVDTISRTVFDHSVIFSAKLSFLIRKKQFRNFLKEKKLTNQIERSIKKLSKKL